MISSIIFSLLLIGASVFFFINVKKIRRNILLGRDVSFSGNTSDRIKTMVLVAFGQQKMFARPIPAILHFFLYSAFIITQIELLEIVFDGVAGSHRAFRASLGGFYTFMVSFIEILSVLAFIGTVAFLARRNLLKVPRLIKSELNGWPKLDANLILIGEITLICFIFMMNGADEVLYSKNLSHATNLGDGSLNFSISRHLGPLLFGGLSENGLHTIERIGWWGHILMVLGFLNFLPYSKHLHIVLGFPNTFYSNLKPKGEFTTLESVTDVVAPNFDPNYVAKTDPNNPVRFGAKDVQDLNWKNLMDAYSCTECGRCTSACPQSITGKLLSPRKIMMDTRDRLEEVGKNMDANKGTFVDDGKSLLGDYIKHEEIWACNTCNACVQECPVNIDPLAIIVELRRYLVMEESNSPSELNTMFTNIENNGAPWQFSQADRANWIKES
ncbi:MAG: (Fe-S)-binding protein [Bacteroidota bacterium]|nr:(Fe-S)-binding protein [Bacteroidota bacterium]MDP3144441.1 (Fe-S)-binding protein [Bacteroidota bacterium]